MCHFILSAALAGLALSSVAVAQTAPAPPAAANPASVTAAITDATASFADEPVILRDSKIVLQYNADGTGTRTESQSFTLQSEAAVRNFGVVSLAYASSSQTADFVFVRVHHTDGTVVETPLTDVQEQTPPVTQQAPLYSDIKLKQIPVRGLRQGDTVEWQTRVVIQHPEAANQFWGVAAFVRDLVTLHQTVELRVPARLTPTVWTNPANHVTPERTTEGAETVYRWKWTQSKPTAGKAAEAAAKASEGKLLTPDEELDKTEGRLPDIAFSTFADWAAVGAWYRGLEAGRTDPGPGLRAKVAEITAGKTTTQDKVVAVYDWVAANIRYIGVDLGIGRFQPHSAETVLANQYGDCKDKHTLLAGMLNVLGIQADAVLIGAGIRFNPDVPSPAAFNHLITHFQLNGKPVWADTTSEVAAFQVLVPPIRDKRALVVPPSEPATIQRTPAGLPYPAFETLTVKGTLDKDLTSESDFVWTLHDDTELALRAGLRQISPSQNGEAIQRLMAAIGFAGTTSDAAIDNRNNLEKPIVLRFHYHREHDSDWGDRRITVPFEPTGLPYVDDKKPLTQSLQLGAPRVMTSTVDMQLPAGWSAELPEAVHQAIPQVSIDATYRLTGSTFHAERKVTVLADKVAAADWKSYSRWYTASDANGVPYLPLHTSGSATQAAAAGTAGTGPAPAAPKTEAARLAEAKRLVESANQKLDNNDVSGAEKDLNAAKEFNPNQQQLWGDLGVVAARRGKMNDAMKLYRKEVELYPSSDFAWRNIVVLQSRDDLKAEIATAREWVAASPETLEPRATLIQALTLDGQNAAALAAAREAATALPGTIREGTDFQFLLGQAQLNGGELAAGAETLQHLIQTDASPLQINNAVYELAKARQLLPTAERAQRDMLRKLADESLTWTGDESPRTMLNNSSLQLAGWDTLAWVLFQEGKLPDAESYLEAAWRGRPDPEVGEHLGDVLTAMHRDAEASRAYILAEYTAHNAPGTRASLKQKAEAARKKGPVDLGAKNAEEALTALQTFPVPVPDGNKAPLPEHATYLLLFTPEKVVSAKEPPGINSAPADAVVRQAKLNQLFPRDQSAALYMPVTETCKNGQCKVRLGLH